MLSWAWLTAVQSLRASASSKLAPGEAQIGDGAFQQHAVVGIHQRGHHIAGLNALALPHRHALQSPRSLRALTTRFSAGTTVALV